MTSSLEWAVGGKVCTDLDASEHRRVGNLSGGHKAQVLVLMGTRHC